MSEVTELAKLSKDQRVVLKVLVDVLAETSGDLSTIEDELNKSLEQRAGTPEGEQAIESMNKLTQEEFVEVANVVLVSMLNNIKKGANE